MVRLACCDRDVRQELDDERWAGQGDVAVDEQGPAGRLQPDVPGGRVQGQSLDAARKGRYAGRGFAEPFLRESARPDGVDNGGVNGLRTKLCAEAQRIGAHLECPNGTLPDTDR